MPKRILVLGASGFIGRRVIAALVSSNGLAPVVAVHHRAPDRQFATLETLRLDATDASALARAAQDTQGIVSCIAGSAATIVGGAAALARLAREFPTPLRIVHFSSMAVYGRATGSVDESGELRGDLDAYSAAKREAELLLASCPDVVTLRPGIVYGPDSPWWSDRIARLLVAQRLGDLGARGEGICNLLHVDDAARAAVTALTREIVAAGPYNLAMANPPTWNAYFAGFAAALGLPAPRRISTPRLAAELLLVSPTLKILERVLGATRATRLPPAIRPWLLDRTSHRLRLDSRKAEAALGIRWTPLQEGLRATADWFIAGGRAKQ